MPGPLITAVIPTQVRVILRSSGGGGTEARRSQAPVQR